MFERFTEEAIKVIMLAQEESRRLGHNFVGTEQLLLGLIGEGTGIAAQVLQSFDLNLENTRIEVEKIIGRGEGNFAIEVPFTPRAKTVLNLTLAAARELGHNYLGTEHLLLAIIREGGGVAARVLENLGVNLEELQEQTITAIEDSINDSSVPEIDRNKSSELCKKFDRLLAIFQNAQYEGIEISDRVAREFNKITVLNSEIEEILARLPEYSNSEIKEFLTELRKAIATTTFLSYEAKEEALEMLLIIAEACQNLKDSRQQKLAISALKILQPRIDRITRTI